nr:hypothetical protein [Collimonas antrihumi]
MGDFAMAGELIETAGSRCAGCGSGAATGAVIEGSGKEYSLALSGGRTAVDVGNEVSATVVPHFLQNFASGTSDVEHEIQIRDALPFNATGLFSLEGEVKGSGEELDATVVPHFLQNLAPGTSGAEHERQEFFATANSAIGIPHDLQNLAPSLFSEPHLPQLAINYSSYYVLCHLRLPVYLASSAALSIKPLPLNAAIAV